MAASVVFFCRFRLSLSDGKGQRSSGLTRSLAQCQLVTIHHVKMCFGDFWQALRVASGLSDSNKFDSLERTPLAPGDFASEQKIFCIRCHRRQTPSAKLLSAVCRRWNFAHTNTLRQNTPSLHEPSPAANYYRPVATHNRRSGHSEMVKQANECCVTNFLLPFVFWWSWIAFNNAKRSTHLLRTPFSGLSSRTRTKIMTSPQTAWPVGWYPITGFIFGRL